MKRVLYMICLGTVFCFGQSDWGLGLGDRVCSLAEDNSGYIYTLCSESLHCVTYTGDKFWTAGIGGNYIGYLGGNNFIVAGDSLTKMKVDTVLWSVPVNGVHVLQTEDGGFLVLDTLRHTLVKTDTNGSVIRLATYSGYTLTDLKQKNGGGIICAARQSETGRLYFFELNQDGDTNRVIDTEKNISEIGRSFAVLKNGNLAVHYSKGFYHYLLLFDTDYTLLNLFEMFNLGVGATSASTWTYDIAPTADEGCIVSCAVEWSEGPMYTGGHTQLMKYSKSGDYQWQIGNTAENYKEKNSVLQSVIDGSFIYTVYDIVFKYTGPDTTGLHVYRPVRLSEKLEYGGYLLDVQGYCIGVIENANRIEPGPLKARWSLKTGIYFMQRDDGSLIKILIR